MRVSVNKVLASNKDALERWMASQGCAEFARRCASAFPNLTAAERAMLEEAARQTPDELLQSAREKVRQDEALKRWFARELVLAAKSAAAGPHREAKAPHQVALKTWASHNPVWAVVAAGVAVESKKHQFDGPVLPFLARHKTSGALVGMDVVSSQALNRELATGLVALTKAFEETSGKPTAGAMVLKVTAQGSVTACRVAHVDTIYRSFLLELRRKRSELGKPAGWYVSPAKQLV